jgi:hypothetical protein
MTEEVNELNVSFREADELRELIVKVEAWCASVNEFLGSGDYVAEERHLE